MNNVIDAIVASALMNKSEIEVQEVIENMTSYNNHWLSERNMPRKVGVHEVDTSTCMESLMDAFQN